MKNLICTLLCLMAGCIVQAQTPAAYSMPNGAGTLVIGTTGNGADRWLDKEDTLVKEKRLGIRHIPLKDTQGFILEITNLSLPDSARIAWAIGGFDSPQAGTRIAPEYCKDNVFNVEGNLITVYHGKVMQLKVTQALVPPSPDIRLCNGRKQDTPMTLFQSGKKTDVPVLCGITSIKKGEKAYLCLYKPNRSADYTYYMLPRLVQSLTIQP